MSRALYDADELWERENEVEDLWCHEEERHLREVAQNSGRSDCCASCECECVSDEDAWWVPVVVEESKGRGDEREEDRGRCFGLIVLVPVVKWVEKEETGDNEGLTGFEAVDAGVDVDGVCAEDCEESNEDLI